MIKVKSLFISGLSVSLAVAIGRVFGFLREILLATVFGQTYEADIATLSLMIPDIMVNIILGGAFSAAFMPSFVKASDEENFNILVYLHYTIGGFFLGITILFFIYAADFGYMLAPSLPYVAQQELVLLLKISCWSIPFIVCSCIVTTSLNAKGTFFLPALGTSIINIIICFSIFLSILINQKLLTLVAFSIVFGSILRWLFQVIPVLKKSRSIKPHLFKAHIDRVSIFFKYGQVLLSTSALMAIPIFSRFYILKTGAGQLANLNYTQKLMDLIITFIIGSIITVILPKLVRSQNNSRTILLFSIVIFPCFVVGAIAFFYSSNFIVSIFFGYGAFNGRAIEFLVLHIKEAAFVLPFYSTVFFLTGSLAVTDLAYKSAIACLIGLGLFLILVSFQLDTLTYKVIYQSMAFGYCAIFFIQILFICLQERQVSSKTYVYNK